MCRDRVDRYKPIQFSCALGRNRGTTDHGVNIVLFLLHTLQCILFVPLLKTSHLLVRPNDYTHWNVSGEQRVIAVGGDSADTQEDRPSWGCVQCNSKPMSGRVTARTGRLIDETLIYSWPGFYRITNLE